MATLAPSAARRLAMAAPMPREPPVISAILPSSFLVIVFLLFFNLSPFAFLLATHLRRLIVVRVVEFHDQEVPCVIRLVRQFEIAVGWNTGPSSRKGRTTVRGELTCPAKHYNHSIPAIVWR